MKKETFTDKMIKRTYGITGPLDEQKRREADRMGNISFMVLYYLLTITNAVAFCLAFVYPNLMAFAYPAFLTFILMGIGFYFIFQTRKNRLTSIDPELLDIKETRKLHYTGIKAGLYFGIWMFFTLPFMQVLIDHKDYLTELLSIRNVVAFFFQALLMGTFVHFQTKSRLKQALKEYEELED